MMKNVCKSICISYIVSFILLLAFALVMFYMNVSDKTVGIFVICTYFFSTLFGGVSIAKSVKRRKFLWGIIIGGIYFAIIFLLSMIGNDNVSSAFSSIVIGTTISVLGGMIGGMLG